MQIYCVIIPIFPFSECITYWHIIGINGQFVKQLIIHLTMHYIRLSRPERQKSIEIDKFYLTIESTKTGKMVHGYHVGLSKDDETTMATSIP